MKTLVVYCHPVEDSYCAALHDAALEGLRAGGHQVRVTDLYTDEFDPVFSASDHSLHLDDPVTKPGIARYASDLQWCESLVLIYPTWWSGQPAMLKGWIDRVLIQGVAWTLPGGANRLRPRLRNIRRITTITTHGSSKFINMLEGETGKSIAHRSFRVLCKQLCRTRWIALYRIDTATDADRAAFIDKVRTRLVR